MCHAVVFILFFFFQAEDGIRDWSVTGVQTCALPIYFPPWTDTVQLDYRNPETRARMQTELLTVAARCDGVRCDMAMLVLNRSEERRVGKECRCGGSAAE